MFREMRRAAQQLPTEESEAILARGTSGVLALTGDDGYPYAVPLSYCYTGGRLLFHSALKGHKIDAVRRSDKASFCVIDQDEVQPLTFTTHFRSVIAFGRVRIIEDAEEKRRAIEALSDKFSASAGVAARDAEIDREFPALCMLEMTVEHLTGKEAVELTRARKQ